MATKYLPLKQDLLIRRGDTFTWSFKANSGIDFGIAVVRSQCRVRNNQTSDLIIDFTTDLDSLNKTVQISLTPQQTNDLIPNQGFWDLEVQQGDVIYTWFEGKVVIKPQVTIV